MLAKRMGGSVIEGSGSNFKIIKGTVVTGGTTFDVPITSSEDKVLVGAIEVNRFELLEAMGVTEEDLKKLKGAK